MRSFIGWAIAALSTAVLATGCAPSVRAPHPVSAGATVAHADAEADQEEAEAEAAEIAEPAPVEPALADLYPSLGDEEIAPTPELDEERASEEEFLSQVGPDGRLKLDPTRFGASFDIPMELTPTVEQYLNYFTTRGRKWYATWLSRSGRYLPMMRQVFRENGLPEDLVYIAMIESGFSNRAWSRTKASGPWQFMRATGSRYGLDDDWWIDERRDPELATRAAAAHLKDLYEEFGDWYLAAAAYNAGSGKINRAIRKYDSRNFWELAAAGRYLKLETKHYVPKLIACAIIAKHPEQFGFKGIEYLEPLEYEVVAVPDATDLRVVSECAGADYDSVLELNPSLKRFCTPPGVKAFEVRVPKGTSEAFAASYAKLDPKKRVTFRKHTVHSGDTLSTIARRYGTDVAAIMRMNGLASARKMRINTDLVIPVPAGNGAALATVEGSLAVEAKKTNGKAPDSTPSTDADFRPVRVAAVPASAPKVGERDDYDDNPLDSRDRTPPPNREKTKVTLATGDTLWSLSLKYGVSVNEIKRWNGIRNHRSVQAGATLTLYLPKDKARAMAATPAVVASTAVAPRVGSVLTYKVKAGDTVWDIAREHNVDPLDLLKDNNLSRRSKIKPGDVLEIRLVAGTGAGK